MATIGLSLALFVLPANAATSDLNGAVDVAPVDSTPVAVGGGWVYWWWSGSNVPWNPFTFTATQAVVLRVTDGFCYGDRFSATVTPGPQVWPFGPGATTPPPSSPPTAPSCGGLHPTTPDAAWADKGMSHGCWIVGPGTQSVTLGILNNPYGGGGAWLRVDTGATLNTGAVPGDDPTQDCINLISNFY